MPRKTSAFFARIPSNATDFNEAAARCRGKQSMLASLPFVFRTSMRPRLDAAENGDRLLPGLVRRRTSMRPRLDAAENVRSSV